MRNAQPVVGAGPVPAAHPSPVRSQPAAQDVPEVRAPMESQSQVTGIGQPVAQVQSPAASAADEKAAYDQAFQALKELRYADAAEEFQSFLDQYPNSEYADNAQYWLGESYYVTRNYDIALTAFQTCSTSIRKAPRARMPCSRLATRITNWSSGTAPARP